MVEIIVPHFDVNSQQVTLVEWRVAEGGAVRKDQPLCTVETSKSILDLLAERDGYLVRQAPPGAQLAPGDTAGWLVDEPGVSLEAIRLQLQRSQPAAAGAAGPKVTIKARELLERHHIAADRIAREGVVTEEDVWDYLRRQGLAQPVSLPPGQLPAGLRRVLVITAGIGAMQVIDILLHDPGIRLTGCLDDDRKLHDTDLFGVRVLGGLDRIEPMWRTREFDAAIVATSSRVELRCELYERCVALGIPMVNAIDPTVRINRGCVIGQGNVICSQTHLGVATVLGDNNFISAHSNIDHHNHWGSHITTGPNCVFSSLIRVEDKVKFGTGIFVQPGATIGREALIASGAVLLQSVPPRHAVKVKIQTRVVPRDQAID